MYIYIYIYIYVYICTYSYEYIYVFHIFIYMYIYICSYRYACVRSSLIVQLNIIVQLMYFGVSLVESYFSISSLSSELRDVKCEELFALTFLFVYEAVNTIRFTVEKPLFPYLYSKCCAHTSYATVTTTPLCALSSVRKKC